MKANYVTPGSARWAHRISRAMTYYAHRPGDDLHREDDETPAAELRFRHRPQRDEPHAAGRSFYTSDGQKIPLAEAEDRFFAQVEARREQARQQREAARAERKTVRDAAFEDRCRRFVAGEGTRPGLTRERRQVLVDRWRQTRHAKERLPDPVFRIYRVILSTERAVMDGRDIREVLETAVVGATRAVAGAVGHGIKTAYRDAQRDHERHTRAQARADEWMYVRHDTASHPHVHAVMLVEGRGLYTRDLDRMRETLEQLERAKERQQDRAQQRDDGGRD